MKFNPFKTKTWNVAEIDRLREFIEDHPETATLGNIIWWVSAVLFAEPCNSPITGQLDRQRLAWHLRIPYAELTRAIYPISEKAAPEGWTLADVTRPRIIEMLQTLAKTGKVTWR